MHSVKFRASTCHYHFALGEDKPSGLRLMNADHCSWKSLWVILSVSTRDGKLSQIKSFVVKFSSSDDIVDDRRL